MENQQSGRVSSANFDSEQNPVHGVGKKNWIIWWPVCEGRQWTMSLIAQKTYVPTTTHWRICCHSATTSQNFLGLHGDSWIPWDKKNRSPWKTTLTVSWGRWVKHTPTWKRMWLRHSAPRVFWGDVVIGQLHTPHQSTSQTLYTRPYNV